MDGCPTSEDSSSTDRCSPTYNELSFPIDNINRRRTSLQLFVVILAGEALLRNVLMEMRLNFQYVDVAVLPFTTRCIWDGLSNNELLTKLRFQSVAVSRGLDR